MAHETAEQWDPQLYESKHAFVWQLGERLVELLNPERGEQILDIGCGTGHLTAKIAAIGAQVIGLDGSSSMIEEARKNYPGIRFIVADARDFHFDEPFDAVFSNAALHWVAEARSVIECVRAALKPGGRFVAEFGGKGNIEKLVSAFYASLDSIHYPAKRNSNPWYFPGISEYSALLEQNGLEVMFAALFDRPTPLDDGEAGMRNWIKMFAGSFYVHVPPQKRDAFVENVETMLRPVLFREGSWRIDCRRLRIVARKLL